MLENLALRQQLSTVLQKRRPRIGLVDRAFWVVLRRVWARWSDAVAIVRPETVIGWHRAGFSLHWRWLSKRGRSPGRAAVGREVRDLVRRMARENGWGAPRIHATFRVLYVWFAIRHSRREIVHWSVTESPTSPWVVQQLREVFPFDDAGGRSRYLVCDRDTVPYHRELAESHRYAARVLRDEEAKACATVPAVAAARADIPGAAVAAVEEIREPLGPPGVRTSRGYVPLYLRGAKLTLRGGAGTGDVERLLACRIARAAAGGDDGVNPVAVRGASARVRPEDGGSLAVELRAGDETAAAEVLRRARALASR